MACGKIQKTVLVGGMSQPVFCASGSECSACLRAELETARAALAESLEARRITEEAGGPVAQLNAMVDELRASLAACEAERKRDRIAHLRRMGEATEVRFDRWYNGSPLAETRFPEWWIHRRHDQYRRFTKACRAAIEREGTRSE